MDRYTDDHDHHFIDAIRIHHASTIALAEFATDNTKRPEITTLAKQLIAAAEQTTAQLEVCRDDWFPDAPETDFRGIYDTSEITIDDDELQQLADAPDFDVAAIERLITHYQAAIEMAETMLEVTDRPELQDLSHTIITTHQSEIEQLQAWQREW